ncbi:MAG: hypothetical protein ACRDPH_02915 [Marmoricola sp.]
MREPRSERLGGRPRCVRATIPGAVLPIAVVGLLLAGCGQQVARPGAGSGTGSPDPTPSQRSQPLRGHVVRTARVPGGGAAVTLTRQAAPRGGFQLRLYVGRHGRRIQLTDASGNPAIPFTATDTTPQTTASADCTGGGVTITRADAGGSSGWTVTRTTYRLADGRPTRSGTRKLADEVTRKQLRHRFPDLVAGRMLRHCG